MLREREKFFECQIKFTERTLFDIQIGTKVSYNRIVHMRDRLPERA